MKYKAVLLVAVMMVASVFAIISISDSADAESRPLAQPDSISVSPSDNGLSLKAGESKIIYLDVSNNFEVDLIVYIDYIGNDPDVKVTYPEGLEGRRIVVEKDGGINKFILEVHISEFAKSTDHALNFVIKINDPLRGETITAAASNSLLITVTSELSAGEQYNKILGFIDNHLPAPLNTPIVSAAITILVWILVATVVAYFILPLVIHTGKQVVDDTEKIAKRLIK